MAAFQCHHRKSEQQADENSGKNQLHARETTDSAKEKQTLIPEPAKTAAANEVGHEDDDSQQDQKLDPSGKINSLSLIALGLGPKRDTAEVPPPPKPPQ